MHTNRAKRIIYVAAGLVLIAVAVGAFFLLYDFNALPAPNAVPVFAGDSKALQVTEVVPTLGTPIPEGKNAVWCASFLSAWKTLEADLAKEPIALADNPQIARALNKAVDPRPHIPTESLYTAAGLNQKGITGQIRKDLSQKFPHYATPAFPGIMPDSFVAYAYLEANAKFSKPYFQNREPLEFTDTAGKVTKLNSFGIRPEDDYAYHKLRGQPEILFETRNKKHQLTEFIVDLDRTSQPNQIILAVIDPKPTLMEMLATATDMIEKAPEKKYNGLGPRDVLFVPDMVWRITHRFAGLEGQEFTNAELKGQRIDVARQDIQFRLNRSGAELRSESKMYCKPMPTYYVFDRPFLLYMKKRDAEMPYFVMWVENAELLNRWSDH